MLELGRYSAEEHERIGKLAAKHADLVIGVGPRSKKLSEAAFGTHKNKNRAHHFDDAYAAAGYLSGMIEAGDVILIKGSQSIRVERVVEALLADTKDLEHLVRQEREWKKR
jgi:UDP-N-acetylmuramoyl-tripeptide--D-alanyl-D-alanine ligase